MITRMMPPCVDARSAPSSRAPPHGRTHGERQECGDTQHVCNVAFTHACKYTCKCAPATLKTVCHICGVNHALVKFAQLRLTAATSAQRSRPHHVHNAQVSNYNVVVPTRLAEKGWGLFLQWNLQHPLLASGRHLPLCHPPVLADKVLRAVLIKLVWWHCKIQHER